MVVFMSDPGIKSLMRENIYITDIPMSVGASKRFILATSFKIQNCPMSTLRGDNDLAEGLK